MTYLKRGVYSRYGGFDMMKAATAFNNLRTESFRMARGYLRDQGLHKVLENLRMIDEVKIENLSDQRHMLTIEYKSKLGTIEIDSGSGDYRDRKVQYERLRAMLQGLGVEEGATYTPPPPSSRPITPQMRASREKQKQAFASWQGAWRIIREAEKTLDVEYEIAQMKDYY